MNRKKISITLIALIAVFGIHIVNVKMEGARLDMTEQKLFSLTDGTHEILDKMSSEGVKPIEVKLYFSHTTGKSLPKFIKNFITYENYIRNLLREYERYAGGKIKVTYIDPKPDSDDAEDAGDYGLEGKPLNQHGDLFYFGLVFVTQTGSKDVIEFLWPEKQDSIEYEISKRIYNLLWPKKQRIGILSGLDVLPDNNPYMAQLMRAQGKMPTEPWLVTKAMEDSYTVSRIDPDADGISKDDYDLVIVIHPKGFGDKAFWNINEWVVTGGRTIVFLDPFSIADQAPQDPNQPWAQLQYKPASDFKQLLDVWGIERLEDTFAVDYELGVKRMVDRRGNAEKVITHLQITDKNAKQVFNQDVPIFNGLSDVQFYMAGILQAKGDAKAELTPLIKTTAQGAGIKVIPGFGDKKELAYADLNTPTKFLDKYQPSGEQVLAYMIHGQLPTAFPDGATFPKETPKPPPGLPPGMKMPVDENAEMVTKEPISQENFAETRVIVFSDVDLIADALAFQNSLFGVTAVNDNYKVFLNTIDYLLGAEELMSVRSKGSISRPFELFDLIEAQADQQMLTEEQKIRTEIERFQEEVREKQRGMNQKDAVLFQKKLGDEVATLNENIRQREKDLREIRKAKRAALEGEEFFVRMSIIAFMPSLICLLGLMNFVMGYRRNLGRGE